MNMDEQKLTYEQFKEDILQWKNTHREEYNRFSRLMTNGDERQYLAICKAIFRQLPGIRREWELSWNDDSTDGLANIDMQFAENAVPGQIVELYRRQREGNNPLPDNISPVTFWGRIKSFFYRQIFQAGCHPFGTARVELAVLRKELRGDGFHDRETDEESES